MALKRGGQSCLLRPLVGVLWACETRNESQLGGRESIVSGEGVVIKHGPLGFPSFYGHVGKSVEVLGCG
jgi:hypothetical protein